MQQPDSSNDPTPTSPCSRHPDDPWRFVYLSDPDRAAGDPCARAQGSPRAEAAPGLTLHRGHWARHVHAADNMNAKTRPTRSTRPTGVIDQNVVWSLIPGQQPAGTAGEAWALPATADGRDPSPCRCEICSGPEPADLGDPWNADISAADSWAKAGLSRANAVDKMAALHMIKARHHWVAHRSSHWANIVPPTEAAGPTLSHPQKQPAGTSGEAWAPTLPATAEGREPRPLEDRSGRYPIKMTDLFPQKRGKARPSP
jgi:hypothetical protein